MNLTRSPRSKKKVYDHWAYPNLGVPRSKYGSRKTTRGGITYQSTLEGDYADNLTWKLKAGEITKIERQVRIRLVVNGKLICCYDVDFRVTLPDGRVQYIEVKGYETELFKTKWKLARALYPDWEWVMVRKNKMNYE